VRICRAAYAARANSSLELSFAITKIRHLIGPFKNRDFRRFKACISTFGGAAGYRPRVQPAYYMCVYRYSWQASPFNIGNYDGKGKEMWKIS